MYDAVLCTHVNLPAKLQVLFSVVLTVLLAATFNML